MALQKLEQLSVDLITLDMEMPELDGLSTLKIIREKKIQVRVIIFSTKTVRGAEAALNALAAGADDVVAKPNFDEFQNFNSAQDAIKEILLPKVLQFKKLHSYNDLEKPTTLSDTQVNFQIKTSESKIDLKNFIPKLVVIASSTGGPNALESIFSHIKGNYRIPILIVQHMPPVFTQILAKRLKQITDCNFKEAQDGEQVLSGNVYVAPGDFHMEIRADNEKYFVKLHQKPLRNSVRPCADYLFESASQVVKSSLLGIVLTGMGEDGAVGAKTIKANGGAVIIQERSSCVVFGMPGKVFENNNFDSILKPEEISKYLKDSLL